MNKEAIENASRLGALGLDPIKYLTTRNKIERHLMVEVANRMIKHKEIMDQNLAVKIAEQVSKLFKR
jgi:hypothetical protein